MTAVDLRRIAAATALAAALLMASACTGEPDDEGPAPKPTATPSASPSVRPAGVLLAEHDGYVAVTGNCIGMDWSPVEVLGLFEPGPPTGFYIQGTNPPDSICKGNFPIGGPGSTQDIGTADVRLILHPNERKAATCGATAPNQAEDDDPTWDYVGGTLTVDGDGFVMMDLRAGALCVNVFMTLEPSLLEKLTDPKAELTAIVMELAANGRETALRENHPELPAPSAS